MSIHHSILKVLTERFAIFKYLIIFRKTWVSGLRLWLICLKGWNGVRRRSNFVNLWPVSDLWESDIWSPWELLFYPTACLLYSQSHFVAHFWPKNFVVHSKMLESRTEIKCELTECSQLMASVKVGNRKDHERAQADCKFLFLWFDIIFLNFKFRHHSWFFLKSVISI